MSVVVYAARLPDDPEFVSDRFSVQANVLSGDRDYWRGLADVWDDETTIINVEHDMEFSDELVDELLACPQPLCTHAYPLYFPTTHQHEPHFAHSVSLSGCTPPIENIVNFTARGIEWVSESAEWADFSGIGFCKITPDARCGPLVEQGWTWLEMSVNGAVGVRWHVHWQPGGVGIEHYHS